MIKPYTDQFEVGGCGSCYIAEQIINGTYNGGMPYGRYFDFWAVTTEATKDRIKAVDKAISNNIKWS